MTKKEGRDPVSEKPGDLRDQKIEGEIQAFLSDLERRYDADALELAFHVTRAQMRRIYWHLDEFAYVDYVRRQADIFDEQRALADELLAQERIRHLH